MTAWTVRAATAEDLPAIRECYGTVFPKQRPLAADRSLYLQNPAGDAISIIAEAEGRVVGMFAVLPVPLQLGGRSYPGGHGLDAMTRAEYRGKGIVGTLAEACFDQCAAAGIDALYALPNANSYGPLRKANFDHVLDITVAQRPVPGPRTNRGARGAAAAAVAAALPRGRRGGFIVERCTTDEAPLQEALALWQLQGGECRVDRSPQWWRWRFSADRGRYEWILARSRSGDLAAAVVLGWRDGQAGLAEVLGSDAAAIESAIAAAIRAAAGHGYTALSTATNRPEVLRALTRTGFLRRRKLPLVVRRISYRTLPANVHAADAWSISPGDIHTY
jgi:predicted N-acetyltransferase YhbS